MIPGLSIALPAGLVATASHGEIHAAIAREAAAILMRASRHTDDLDAHLAMVQGARDLDRVAIALQVSVEMQRAILRSLLPHGG